MKFLKFALTFLTVIQLNAQEVVLETSFAPRDFIIDDSTIVYIEKRSTKSFNMLTNQPDTLFINNYFFVGGYGLKLFKDSKTNKIITASNELIRNISSIRFYDIETKSSNKFNVYYTTELMDFLVHPKENLFFLSKKDLQIQIIEYGQTPRYIIKDSIKLEALSRKMQLHNGNLFYVTDYGEVYNYNLKSKKKSLIYRSNELLSNFIIEKTHNQLYATSANGNLIRIDLDKNSNYKKINLGASIIEAINLTKTGYIVTGDWNGVITILAPNSLKIIKQFNNKKRIIKIESTGTDIYTSSSDCTIKKWPINLF